ncbi:MAG TPA: hypothetical protein VN081_05185 [Dongiaceae bacterium]|nr:hypothetical protein [Dongiaceae bacterium]
MKIGIKRVGRASTAFLLVLGLIGSTIINSPLIHAAGATDVWVGTAGDGKFSTASNWQAGTVPVSGDTLKFLPLSTGSDYQDINLTNDLSGVSFAGVIAGSAATGYNTQFYIDTMTYAAGATISRDTTNTKQTYVYGGTSSNTQSGTVTANGALNLTNGAYVSGTLNAAGLVTVDAQSSLWLQSGSNLQQGANIAGWAADSGATIANGLTFPNGTGGYLGEGSSRTISTDWTIGSPKSGQLNQLAFGSCATPANSGGGSQYLSVGCATYAPATFTLSGNITLNADLLIDVASQSDVKITGNVTYNGHTIKITQESQGTLEVGGSSVAPTTFTTNLSDSQPTTDYTVQNLETAVLDGQRQSVTVDNGGILKGTGTANGIYVSNGGTIAPGHSPGTLTATNYLDIEGTYQAELQTSAPGGYDQVIVGSSSDTGTDVTIGANAVLDTQLYSGYNIKKGDQFMIIKDLQASTYPVSGTFKGLPEGQQFAIGGITFNITYKGGDGNDVVLTALNDGSDPNAPNTAVMNFVKANPWTIIVLGSVTASVLVLAGLKARRTNR